MKLRIWIGHSEEYLDVEGDLGYEVKYWKALSDSQKLREVESALFEYFDYGYEEIEEE